MILKNFGIHYSTDKERSLKVSRDNDKKKGS
jgi:hypothetical protein